MDISHILWLETLGTATLILLGNGVVANVVLKTSKGKDGGWLLISFGWGLAVYAGVIVAWKSGAHLNPAVTFGLLANGAIGWNVVPAYLAGQFLGAFIGATLVWLTYKKQYEASSDDPAGILATFSTGPAVRSYALNVLTEIVGTFVLVYLVLAFGHGGGPAGLGALPVALIVVVIGTSLGGPTGYAINPARDLGPRIIHALLPIKGKGSSDWAYAWVPVVGPIIGGLLAGWFALATAGLSA